MLSHIRIVLLETSHPGNIGAVARAMKNMGLSQLTLVQPKLFPHQEATSRAAGADDLLAQAVVVDSLAAALADCQQVFAISARTRRLNWPMLDSYAGAKLAVEQAAHAQVALLFGNEQSGLPNDAFEYCQQHIYIPANSTYSSLNLAAAVQVVSYEVHQAYLRTSTSDNSLAKKIPVEPLATADEINHFYQHLEKVLYRIEFLSSARHSGHLLHRLKRLFSRTQLAQVEVNILRGILKNIERHLKGGS